MKNKKFIVQGYTLIEILVAVALFFIIAAAPTSLFISSFRGQARALALREIIDSSFYSLEFMSRALRMAEKDRYDGLCIGLGDNYENPGGDDSRIRFLNYQGFCQEFYLADGQLMRKISRDGSEEGLEDPLPLTPDDLKITLLEFKLSGREQEDDLQPRVTILLKITKKASPESKLRIQTTVSQRNLDVTY